MFGQMDMRALEKELIDLRREFHRYPESAWTEFRTTARVIEELEKLGLTVRYGAGIHIREKMFGLPAAEDLERCWARAGEEIARLDLLEAMRGGYTGCVTEIEGVLPGPVVGIRVDMDCNDLREAENPEHFPAAAGFASAHRGCMHACGHDAHIAIGIGVAKLLCACRERLRGKVILIFQPGEEGLRGAASLTAAGHLDTCDDFFGAHVGIKDMPVGTVFTGAHGFLASTKFDVVFHGVPAHAGLSPEKGRNAMAAAATAVLDMLAIPRPTEGISRINVGTFHSGTGRNVIPAEARLAVETRGSTTEINSYMEENAKRICYEAAEKYGCTCEVTFMGAAGNAECDQLLANRAAEILRNVDGVHTVAADVEFGGGEDVTTMMRRVQERGGQATELLFAMPLKAPHHNNYFDIDERVIGVGARSLAQLALTMGMEQE